MQFANDPMKPRFHKEDAHFSRFKSVTKYLYLVMIIEKIDFECFNNRESFVGNPVAHSTTSISKNIQPSPKRFNFFFSLDLGLTFCECNLPMTQENQVQSFKLHIAVCRNQKCYYINVQI